MSESFDNLMAKLRGADKDAEIEVFNHFAQRLIALAHTRLERALRQKVDPEDVMISAFNSFFIRYRDQQITVDSWDNLWAVLTVITLRKCAIRGRFFHRQRRDLEREAGPTDMPGDAVPWQELTASEPTPEQAAMLNETVEKLMASLDERDRAICVLTLNGKTAKEISAELGYAERTVRRVRETIKKYLERMAEHAEDG
jgi:RNA polymerase sigma-70 factor (ECF subfamily)